MDRAGRLSASSPGVGAGLRQSATSVRHWYQSYGNKPPTTSLVRGTEVSAGATAGALVVRGGLLCACTASPAAWSARPASQEPAERGFGSS